MLFALLKIRSYVAGLDFSLFQRKIERVYGTLLETTR